MATNNEKNTELLKSIDSQLKKQNSLKTNFQAGIMRGLGAALGATIIAAIVFGLLTLLFDTADSIPLIRDFIDSDSLRETINGR